MLCEYIHALPKVELHVHLVGSAGVDTVLELARRHPEAGVPTDRDELADFYTFRDFDHFLKVYWAVQSMLTEARDITTLVTGLAAELARQNVRYAEVTVTPYNHHLDGLPIDALLTGLTDGRAVAAAEHGVELAWVFDIPGEKGAKAGRETLTIALRERPDGLIAFGLGGPEVGIGRAQFEPFFTAAREAGLHSVPHAGETTGPATVWSALHDLGAERIGHGTSSAADPSLLAYLAEHPVNDERRAPLGARRSRRAPLLLGRGVIGPTGIGIPGEVDERVHVGTLRGGVPPLLGLLHLDPLLRLSLHDVLLVLPRQLNMPASMPHGVRRISGPVKFSPVACPSGRRSAPRKRVRVHTLRGFKSHRYRSPKATCVRGRRGPGRLAISFGGAAPNTPGGASPPDPRPCSLRGSVIGMSIDVACASMPWWLRQTWAIWRARPRRR